MDDPELTKLQLAKVNFPGQFVYPFPADAQLLEVSSIGANHLPEH